MLFGKKTHNNQCEVIFTIGSARVTGSIVNATDPDNIIVLYTTEARLVYQEQYNLERFVKSMLSALMEVSMRIQQQGLKHVRERGATEASFGSFTAVFTAPWSISQTRVVKLKRDEAFIVKNDLLQKIQKEEVQAFEDMLVSENSPYDFLENTSLLDSCILSTCLNGYPTNNPIGKGAKTLDVSVFISVISQDVLTHTRELIESVFHTDHVTSRSSRLPTLRGIRKLFRTGDEYLVLEVTGETTNTSIVHDNILLETASFPSGTNTIIRHASKKLNKKPEEMYARLTMLAEDKSERETPEAKKLEAIMYETVTEWMQALRDSLEVVAKGTPVPRTTFLVIDPVWETIYTTALKDHSFELFTFTDRPFTVITLNTNIVRSHCTLQENTQFYPLSIIASLTHSTVNC